MEAIFNGFRHNCGILNNDNIRAILVASGTGAAVPVLYVGKGNRVAEWYYDVLKILFGSSLIEELSLWMTKLFQGIKDLLGNGFVDYSLMIFSAIACSLLVVYFFADLTNQVSREMFSLEKLVVSFVRLFVAFAILIVLPDLVTGIVDIGSALYTWMSSGEVQQAITGPGHTESNGITYFGSAQWPPYADVQSQFEENFNGMWGMVSHMGLMLTCCIPALLAMGARLIGYFLTTVNAVMIVARVFFAPVAVVQIFDEGTRSAGIRYIKRLAADCITMAVMVVIFSVVSSLTATVVGDTLGNTSMTIDNIGSEFVTWGNMAKILVPEITAVGGMAGAAKLAHDVIGV